MWDIALIIIGILALAESLFILMFPNWIIKIGKNWLKNIKTLRKIGLIELIIAIILILIGSNI